MAFALAVLIFILTGDFLLNMASEPAMMPLFVASAALLYGLRVKMRDIYGCLEIIAGIAAIIGGVITNNNADLAHFSTIIGGVYVIVRGLDNINQKKVASSRE